jgi:hypothetical protein
MHYGGYMKEYHNENKHLTEFVKKTMAQQNQGCS